LCREFATVAFALDAVAHRHIVHRGVGFAARAAKPAACRITTQRTRFR
jgi:hypothetical protein